MRRTRWILALLALTVLLVACSKTAPQNTMNPQGPTAQTEKNLLVLVLWPAAAVFLVVEGGILLISIRYRHRKDRDRMPPQIHGNTRLEIGWTIAPAIVLAVIMVPTVSTIWELARQPADAMQITVEGYQWWWGFRYTDPDMTVSYGDHDAIVTADVMVIPAGRTINLSLTSLGGGAHSTSGVPDHEVIHSFWAPQLFGKQDVIPGETNHIVFSADHPGLYFGQCAEFCGLQHAKMALEVVAQSPADFARWESQMRAPARAPADSLQEAGRLVFVAGSCSNCHAIGGTPAAGHVGPDLTHLSSRRTIAAASLPNTRGNLAGWILDPQRIKPGSAMPANSLDPDQLQSLLAYLEGLK